jgi:hypothetical protein
MIEILQEVTDWPDGTRNHIYHINGSGKMVAYDNGSGLHTFSRPLSFDKARRKFVKLEQLADQLPTGAIEVKGSNGATYIVHEGTCTCPGFKFRGNCKHVN